MKGLRLIRSVVIQVVVHCPQAGEDVECHARITIDGDYLAQMHHYVDHAWQLHHLVIC